MTHFEIKDTWHDHNLRAVPIPEKNKPRNVLLYDMFVDGHWHGSRRTMEQVKRYFAHLKKCWDRGEVA